MTPIAIVMMILFMLVIWGGFAAATVFSLRMGESPASAYLRDHPEADVG